MTAHCFCSVFYRCQTVPYVNKYGGQTGSENDVLSVSVERWRIQWKTSLLVVDKGLTHSHLSRQRRAHVSRHTTWTTTYCLVLITYSKWTHNCKVKDNRSRNVEVQPFVSASVAVIRHRTMNTTVSISCGVYSPFISRLLLLNLQPTTRHINRPIQHITLWSPEPWPSTRAVPARSVTARCFIYLIVALLGNSWQPPYVIEQTKQSLMLTGYVSAEDTAYIDIHCISPDLLRQN